MTIKFVFKSFVSIFALVAALTGCSKSPCDDVAWAAENRDICPIGNNPDGGMMNPDSSVTPDSSVPPGAFVVVGQIDSSWGAISKVEMVSGDLATVMAANCTITPIENGWVRFTCNATSAPADKRFLVRFVGGSSTFAVVSNYQTTTPQNGCWLAHGVFIDTVSVNGTEKAWDFVDLNPTVADPNNDCRLDYE